MAGETVNTNAIAVKNLSFYLSLLVVTRRRQEGGGRETHCLGDTELPERATDKSGNGDG